MDGGVEVAGWLWVRLRAGGPWLCGLLLILLMGLALGMAAPKAVDEQTLAHTQLFIGSYIQALPELGLEPAVEFRQALLLNGVMIFAIGLCGLHLLGLPLTVSLLFLKGLSLGYAISFLINYQGLSGFVFIFLSMLPQNLLFIPVFVLAAYLSVRFSLSRFFAKSAPARAIGAYSLRFAVLLAAAVVASLVQGYVCPLLLKIFFIII